MSVRQPWAWALIAGHKDVENRTWNTRYRGTLVIHAAMTDGSLADYRLLRRRGYPPPPLLGHGVLLGHVDLYDVVRDSSSEWALAGHYHFLVRDPVALAEPVPYRAMPGLFRLK